MYFYGGSHAIRQAFKTVCNGDMAYITPLKQQKSKRRRKVERKVDLYSTYRQYLDPTKRSYVDHTELPANTPHLPFLRISIR